MKDLDKLKALFETFHEAVYIVNLDRKILYFNPAASKISGFSSKEMVDSFCDDDLLSHVDDKGVNLCKEGCPLLKGMKENRKMDCHVYLHHKKGYRVPVHVRVIPYTENGVVVGAIEVFTDQTQKNMLKHELSVQKRLSLIDSLTGMFNRRFLNDELPNILRASLAENKLGVIFMDIDSFKKLNDEHGHIYGDEVLVNIAQTINNSLRPSDYAIRFGGDEFLVLARTTDQRQIVKMAQRIGHLIKESKSKDLDSSFANTVSIGIAILEQNEKLIDAINRADSAMYAAKSKSRNNTVFLAKDKHDFLKKH